MRASQRPLGPGLGSALVAQERELQDAVDDRAEGPRGRVASVGGEEHVFAGWQWPRTERPVAPAEASPQDKMPANRQLLLAASCNGSCIDQASVDQISSFVRTRFTTSSATSLVEACPPMSGVRIPIAVASNTAS
jgi:hypothetical protein